MTEKETIYCGITVEHVRFVSDWNMYDTLSEGNPPPHIFTYKLACIVVVPFPCAMAGDSGKKGFDYSAPASGTPVKGRKMTVAGGRGSWLNTVIGDPNKGIYIALSDFCLWRLRRADVSSCARKGQKCGERLRYVPAAALKFPPSVYGKVDERVAREGWGDGCRRSRWVLSGTYYRYRMGV